MCEWLSCGEWCDVQLLCGGRSFSAHRAVLASVSTFLRRLLLSSSDETTTLIVLPDFDIEAMASVLYYIYNGEVVLQKNKLRLFLDITKAMQIYIDCQYLAKIQEDVEDKYFEVEKHSAVLSNSEIFTLGFNNNEDQHIFKIKKCKESKGSLLKYSQSDLDFVDNSGRCQNESELSESRLRNLKSPYEGRQRNSLLRDLFIETYPPNGNVNGLTESVLAISNECYQSPASVLLANANCRHLSDVALTRQPKKATGNSLHSSIVAAEGELQNTYNFVQEYGEVTTDTMDSVPKFSANIRNSALIHSKREPILDLHRIVAIDRNQISDAKKKHPTCDVDKKLSFPIEYQHNRNMEHLIFDNAKRINSDMKSKSSTRVIFNHVLESPWNARKPNNYRPFRRKEKHEDIFQSNQKETNDSNNDTNNNIQKSLQIPEENSNERMIVKEELTDGPPMVENRESFSCTQCDQVFTSGESQAVHMRRHSTNARYTCGECGKTFSQLRNFKYHMSIHRGTREFAATCTVCGKYFNDRGYLSSHMKIHRNRKEYKCTLCPKSFNQRVAYNMHVRIHTGVKPHVCEECGKAFSRKMLLKQHQRTHSGERPYACSHCDKRFADRSNMTLHLRLHTGVKPFSCPMCPKSFTKKHHLKSHLNFHTGSKPYSCPRCGLAFTQSSNMRTHYKKCTAPEPNTSNINLVMPLSK